MRGCRTGFSAFCREGDDVARIFVEIRLPGLLDGMDLARRVRALWTQASVIVTSGFWPESEMHDNVVYMPKPWLALNVLMQAERASDHMRELRAVA